MCVGAKQWESMQTHACGGTPGNYFSPECFLGGAATYAIPEAGAEGGANARAGEVVEKCANACPGTVLGAGYLSRTTTDGFAQAKEHAAEPAAAAKGDVCLGASTAAQIRCRAWWCQAISKKPRKIDLDDFWCCTTCPNDRAVSCCKINNICGIKWPDHRGRWRVHQKSSKLIFLWRRRKWPSTTRHSSVFALQCLYLNTRPL